MMRDLLTEVLKSVRRNKLRTSLTGLSVSWGIFMLILLLGAGNGLSNAFSFGSDRFASNTMMVGGGRTSKAFDGLKTGRRIDLEDRDVDFVGGETFPEIDAVSATVGQSVAVTRGARHFDGYLEGNHPERAEIEKLNLIHGRFINSLDISRHRKVAVMTDNQLELLLKDGEKAEDLLGTTVNIAGIPFKVVGITKDDGMGYDRTLYAPYSTVKRVFAKGKEIDDLTFTFHGLETEEEHELFEKSLKSIMNVRHRAAPDDESAIWIWNRATQNMQMEKGRRLLSTALWIIGLFTLLGGIVGVSNIMLIAVKERTHEFGIRKAIGASPWSITKLIMTESVIITAIFGYIGMVAGLITCEILDNTLGSKTVEVMGATTTMLVDPTVSVGVALSAMAVLVAAGTIAGLLPALKAVKVKPIEALRAE